ncbi:hypothetical protein [Nonomuraea jabiensis]|uniref:hypothetical protein n=1 Tax=Nonomuraea jabiensis TaxID=882448 RepID=UPI003D726F53
MPAYPSAAPAQAQLIFASSYAMGKVRYHATGPSAEPLVQLPVLAEYVAYCQQSDRPVTPKTYDEYLHYHPEGVEPNLVRRPLSDNDEHISEDWQAPGERYTYLITPTPFTNEEGPESLLHLDVSWRDEHEFGWMEYAAFFYPEDLYRHAVQALRDQAAARVRALRQSFCAAAGDASAVVATLRARADRLAEHADTLTRGAHPFHPAGPTHLPIVHERRRAYADVLSYLSLLNVPRVRIERKDRDMGIIAYLPQDRYVWAVCSLARTLPAARQELRGWRVELRSPYGGGLSHPLTVTYHFDGNPDHRPMAEAFARLYAETSAAIAKANTRHAEDGNRTCPRCQEFRSDARLNDEYCAQCIPGMPPNARTLPTDHP